jgi:3-oxoacyl-[acyl-carrier protein] reductase
MDLGIEGKTALVLSAGGGLGSAIATSLSREGVALAITDRNTSALERTAARIRSDGGRVILEAFDLADFAALESFIERIKREFGEIEILVNLSGGPPPTTAANVSPADWAKYFQAMVVSIIHATDLVLPGMRANRWGRIITSASSGVITPIPNLGISNTLRSALVGWSKTLATETARDGITVNLVLPGRIATARIQQLDEARAKREGRTVEDIVHLSTSSIPIQRYGDPEEYANLITFLASRKASYITGSMFRVDGGMIQSV